MKVISWNVNGLRGSCKKGFLSWFADKDADIVCLQEIKCVKEELPRELTESDGYHLYTNSAQKKGYSGVAILTKTKPLKVEYNLGTKRFDEEGRIIIADYPDFKLVNVYLPHGGRQKENLDYKLAVYTKLFEFVRNYSDNPLVIVGDFNIAHTEIDLAKPKQNRNNIMFTPEERHQIDQLLSLGLVDTFREFNKAGSNYTWLSYLPNARERGLGWRIDYMFISQILRPNLIAANIFPETLNSDHCPIGLMLDLQKL